MPPLIFTSIHSIYSLFCQSFSEKLTLNFQRHEYKRLKFVTTLAIPNLELSFLEVFEAVEVRNKTDLTFRSKARVSRSFLVRIHLFVSIF